MDLNIFKNAPEGIYEKLISMGKELPPFDPDSKTPENRVEGCQSEMFLTCRFEDGKLFFSATADALISKGIAATLIKLLNGRSIEEIIQFKAEILQEMGVLGSLSPSRSNGLMSLLYKMKAFAISYIKLSRI